LMRLLVDHPEYSVAGFLQYGCHGRLTKFRRFCDLVKKDLRKMSEAMPTITPPVTDLFLMVSQVFSRMRIILRPLAPLALCAWR
jgi:hypothetical protein